jgi:hypothetical protein
MLDVAVAYNRYRFLGHEFLTWLWYMIDRQGDRLASTDDLKHSLEIGNRIVLENHQSLDLERITINGDHAGFEEGLLALKKGAVVTEVNLVLRSPDHRWQFNLKGESLNISGLKVPEIARPQTPEEMEGFVLEKIYLYDRPVAFVETVFRLFIRQRVSPDWLNEHLPRIRQWIANS